MIQILKKNICYQGIWKIDCICHEYTTAVSNGYKKYIDDDMFLNLYLSQKQHLEIAWLRICPAWF